MIVRFAARFRKQYKKSDNLIKKLFKQRLDVFINNSNDPQLNNHQLTGRLKRLRSINVTGDFRALYSESLDASGDKLVIFEMLGTHSQLYK